ncbi:MAG: hypothetical protein WAL61_00815 [Acidimicrobiales bacterium]
MVEKIGLVQLPPEPEPLDGRLVVVVVLVVLVVVVVAGGCVVVVDPLDAVVNVVGPTQANEGMLSPLPHNSYW